MNQTVLITGTSSGYGKATAELFLDRGWNVVATMRQPKPEIFGSHRDHLKVFPLDVTNSSSVNKAIADAISTFGAIDVLVNNAGIGVVGAFEATPIATVREVVRDQHLRCDGDDACSAAAVSRTEVWCGSQRHLERDPGPDAARRCVHREQSGHRRIHRVAGVRGGVVQCASETG